MTALAWGHHYLMVSPTHFRVDYQINPFMNPDVQPDAGLAMDQWLDLVAAIHNHGGKVSFLKAHPEAPDMVYAMNLALPLTRETGERHTVMSHMRYPQRRIETTVAHDYFISHGSTTEFVGRDGNGPHLESGDMFPFRDMLIAGYGPRSDLAALTQLAVSLNIPLKAFQLTRPGMYHMDLAFCPLDDTRAIVCPDAFDRASADALLALIPEPLVISEAEAIATFCANSIVIDNTVIMPNCPRRVQTQLEAWGFEVVKVKVSEFHLSGGSIRCLTNPLDITLGRDIAHVPGGEVTATL